MSRWNRKNPIPYGQDPASSEGVNQDLNDLFGAVNTLDDEATSHGDDEEVHLPVIEEGDSGKAAVVNSEETGWEKKSVEDLLNVPAMTAKESIADSDELVMADSEASGVLKKFLWSLAKSTLKSYFNDLYQAVNTAILKSLGTTKGDIIVFTASGSPVRLGVGADGQIILADSEETAGIKWGNPPASLASVSDDEAPSLGGDFDLDGHKFLQSEEVPYEFGTNERQVKFGQNTAFFTEVDNTTGTTIDWRKSNKQKSSPSSAPTYTYTAPGGACHLTHKIVMPATPVTPTFPAALKWVGSEPSWDTGSLTYLVVMYYDGTNYWASCSVEVAA